MCVAFDGRHRIILKIVVFFTDSIFENFMIEKKRASWLLTLDAEQQVLAFRLWNDCSNHQQSKPMDEANLSYVLKRFDRTTRRTTDDWSNHYKIEIL